MYGSGRPHSARRRLARRVRLLRIARGWSQETLAALSGLHRTYIGAVERAERNISLDNIEKIAGAFDLPVSVLLDDIEPAVLRALAPYRIEERHRAYTLRTAS